MRNKTRRPLGAVLAIGAALGLIGTAGADVTYETMPIDGWNSVNHHGVITGVDEDGAFVLGPEHGTKHHLPMQSGWTLAQVHGITEPLAGHALGLAWGVVYTDSYFSEQDDSLSGVFPFVWDPLGEFVAVPMPTTAVAASIEGVGADGWANVNTSTETDWLTQGVVRRAFAWNPDTDVRVDVAVPDGYDGVFIGRPLDAGRAIVNGFNQPTWEDLNENGELDLVQHNGPQLFWTRSTNTFVEPDSDNAFLIKPSGGTVATPDFASMLTSGTWEHGSGSMAVFVTDSGWMAGTYESSLGGSLYMNGGDAYPFVHDPLVFAWDGAHFHDLGPDIVAAGGFAGVCAGVTEDGMVVGHMWMDADGITNDVNASHVFVWTAADGLTDISAATLQEQLDENIPGYTTWYGGSIVMSVSRKGKVVFGGPDADHVYAWQRVVGLDRTTRLADFDLQYGTPASGFALFDSAMMIAINGAYPSSPVDDLGEIVGLGYVDGVGSTALFAVPNGATLTGDDVAVQPTDDASIVFDGIVEPGETTVFAYRSGDPEAPALPDDFQVAGTDLVLNIGTTAQLAQDALIHLAIHYDDEGMSAERESQVRLLHYANGEWHDITDYQRAGGFLDTTNNVVYGVSPSLSPFAIVLPTYTFGGIEQPVNADGSSVFKLGRAVPLKFGLTGPTGVDVSGATARLSLYRVSNSVTGTVEEADVSSTGSSNSGDLFRYDSSSGKFIFDLSTRTLSQGSYRADITLDDGSTHSARFSLRSR